MNWFLARKASDGKGQNQDLDETQAEDYRMDARNRLNPSDELWDQWCCKIVDFGNACWVDKQLTTDIQTRQYRCPEVHFMLGVQ